ncbi:MAG: aldo/keto reductase [Oscillospiraceae bacterium]|jgi:diketogulonate reductase-like aldo/keto reductase|nr:aldo/keto reductase [Oscillospiraceae bacterium]
MRRVVLAGGLALPVLGQGAWNIGDDPARAADETAALRRGLELGLNLIDTAEMYGGGRSEIRIGEALRGVPRESCLLVSKVLPQNAVRPALFESCDNSLRRLQTDYLDIYLLHWRGADPLEETVDGMEALVKAGKIRRWGVSNFDTPDMEALWRVPGGDRCAVNQVLYHLGSRGIEYDLLPWLRARGVAAMAYCPLAQAGRLRGIHGDLLTGRTVREVAEKYGVGVMPLLLAFVLRQTHVTAIPKASRPAHVEENARALTLAVSDEDWAAIDRDFWPPTAKMHLDIE